MPVRTPSTELTQGRHAVWLLDLEVAGQQYRVASKVVAPVVEQTAGGASSGIPNRAAADGLPSATEVGSSSLGVDLGFGNFDSTNHIAVDLDHSVGVGGYRTYAIFFKSLVASYSTDQILIGSPNASGGGFRVELNGTNGRPRWFGYDSAGILRMVDTIGAVSSNAGVGTEYVLLYTPNLSPGGGNGSTTLYLRGDRSSISTPKTFADPTGTEDLPMSSALLGYDARSADSGDEIEILDVRIYDFSGLPAASVEADIAEESDLHAANMVGRWTGPVLTEGVTVRTSYRGGLAPLVLERGAELSSVAIELDGVEDWQALITGGAVLEFSPATLYLWWEGSDYADRMPVLTGTMQNVELGEPGEERRIVFDLVARPPRPELFPGPRAQIDDVTWINDASVAIIDEPAKGIEYPYPIGFPGSGDNGAIEGAVPALLARYNGGIGVNNSRLVVAGEHVAAVTVDLIRVDADDGFPDNRQLGQAPVTNGYDELGQPVAYVTFPSWWRAYGVSSAAGATAATANVRVSAAAINTDTPTTGTLYLLDEEDDRWDAYDYVSYSGDLFTLSGVLARSYKTDTPIRLSGTVSLEPGAEYWAAFRNVTGYGGGVKFDGALPVRALGRVVIEALSRSSETLDRSRAFAEAERLESFKIDTVWSGRADLARWVEGELASVFPITRVQTPDGVFYRLMDYTADRTSAVGLLDLDTEQTTQ